MKINFSNHQLMLLTCFMLFMSKLIKCEMKWIKNEFKVLIDAYDCFFQEVDEGSVLVTSFQVYLIIQLQISFLKFSYLLINLRWLEVMISHLHSLTQMVLLINI